jgi:DNA-binding NarL/FixJ family response regulator
MYHKVITKREVEILHLVAHELSTKEIASKLYISTLTVMTHRRNLLNKLDVKNTAGLVRRGFEMGVLKTNQTATSVSANAISFIHPPSPVSVVIL